jgi:hypothetical protein
MRCVRLKAVVWEWVAGENQIENEKKREKKMFVRATVGHVTTCRVLGGDSVIRKTLVKRLVPTKQMAQ